MVSDCNVNIYDVNSISGLKIRGFSFFNSATWSLPNRPASILKTDKVIIIACGLNLDSALQRLAFLLRSRNRLLTHDPTAPMAFRLFVLLRVAFFDGGNQLGKFGFVFGSDFC